MHKGSHDVVELLLSIGSGEIRSSKKQLLWGMMRSSKKTLLKAVSSQCNQVDSQITSIVDENDTFRYHRLSLEHGLEDIAFNEWDPKNRARSLRTIEEATCAYLKSESIAAKLRDCAQMLVDRRRQRAKTTRWEAYSLGIGYQCKEKGCSEGSPLCDSRNQLMSHMRRLHQLPAPDLAHYEKIQKILDSGRVQLDADVQLGLS